MFLSLCFSQTFLFFRYVCFRWSQVFFFLFFSSFPLSHLLFSPSLSLLLFNLFFYAFYAFLCFFFTRFLPLCFSKFFIFYNCASQCFSEICLLNMFLSLLPSSFSHHSEDIQPLSVLLVGCLLCHTTFFSLTTFLHHLFHLYSYPLNIAHLF